jgi:hypothetical protein
MTARLVNQIDEVMMSITPDEIHASSDDSWTFDPKKISGIKKVYRGMPMSIIHLSSNPILLLLPRIV